MLEAFTTQRLLTRLAETVEITHEALLSAWPLLSGTWLADTHADRIIRTGLATTAAEWDRHDRDQAYLYTGSLLVAAGDVAAGDAALRLPDLNRTEREFLAASRSAQRRGTRRRRALAAALVALTVTLAVITGVALNQRNAANSARDVAASVALTAQSQVAAATDPLMSRLDAVAAWRLDQTPAAHAAMLRAAFLPWDAILSNTDAAAGQDNSVAFSPDGTLLAVGTGSDIQLWSTVTHQLAATLGTPGGTSVVSSVTFSGDGRMLAAFAGPGVQLWDLATRRLAAQQELPAGTRTVSPTVAFSPDSAAIAVATGDGIRLLSVSRHGPADVPSLSGTVLLPGAATGPLAFSPHGDLLAVNGGGSIQLWGVTGPQPAVLRSALSPSGITGTFGTPAFSPDGATLAVSTDSGVQLWRVATGRPLRVLPVASTAPVVSLAFSTNGQFLAGGTTGGRTLLWRLADGSQAASLTADSSSSVLVAFGRGDVLAAMTPSAVQLADITGILTTSRPLTTLTAGSPGDGGTAVSTAFSPDGALLAAGYRSGPVVIWNVTRQAVAARLQPPAGVAFTGAVAFSSGGHVLAAGTSQGAIVLWDLDAARMPGMILPAGPGQRPVDSVTFSPAAPRSPGARATARSGHGTSRAAT